MINLHDIPREITDKPIYEWLTVRDWQINWADSSEAWNQYIQQLNNQYVYFATNATTTTNQYLTYRNIVDGNL